MTSKPTTDLWGNLYLKFLFQVENNLFKLQSQNSMQTCPQHSIIPQNSQIGNRLFSFTKYFYFSENKNSLSDYLQYHTGFSDDLVGKKFAWNVGDLGSIPGLGRFPGGGYGNPFQYSCMENPHEQIGLAGYSPWGCKEQDTTH